MQPPSPVPTTFSFPSTIPATPGKSPSSDSEIPPSPHPSSPALSSLPRSSSGDRNSQIDDIADEIFYERHPDLRRRKIQSGETALVAEWNAIRQCEAIVDFRFYERHPELGRRKIIRGETDLEQEWLSIKDGVAGCN